MEGVVEFITDQPLWVWIAAGGALLLVLAIVIGAFVGRSAFRRRVRSFLSLPGEKDRTGHFSDEELLRRTGVLEKMARGEDRSVISQLELDRLWAERLYKKERPSDFRRVLTYAPGTGLFACFLVALRNGRLATTLRAYLADNSDFLVLRNLALSGRGEPFSGAKARHFFEDRLDEIREMTGDPEWASRYFSVKVLLYDDDERSERALWESFGDSYPLIRRTLAEEFTTEDRTRLYERLQDLFLHDPVFEVRKAARTRIRKEFQDLYQLDAANLDSDEAYHVIELLDPRSDDDENAAMLMLAGKNHELRLAAARFLSNSDALEKLLQQADFADRTQLGRIERLLTNAASVNVVGYLESINRNPSPAALYIAAKVLSDTGPAPLITDVAERVFRLQDHTTTSYEELFGSTVNAISARGTESAIILLAREIPRRREQHTLLRMLLTSIPSRSSHVVADTLFSALLDPTFPEREALRQALCQLDAARVLSTALDVVTADRVAYPHLVRMDALMLLGELRLPYALHEILEHLPILPLADAREFTKLLDRYQSDLLERKAQKLLDSVDGRIRASIIAALPATGKKVFLPKIREALGDADPDVRVAAAWALVDYEETRALSGAVAMLRDPVERVRVNAARAIGTAAGASALKSLEEILGDENEVESVKLAAIAGLAASKHATAVDILVRTLEAHEEFTEPIQMALAEKRDKDSLARLVEDFKDADPALRDRITHVFRLMGESAESAVSAVLEEEIAGLQSALAEILEATGHIESRIRLLSHRDPAVRRSAAAFLSKVGSRAAFRGIVMAARDPDADVRVAVTRALEQLATKEGKEILKALENDPERRIRNYTLWAMERLRAKAL